MGRPDQGERRVDKLTPGQGRHRLRATTGIVFRGLARRNFNEGGPTRLESRLRECASQAPWQAGARS
jgi:hypothetical protein